MSAIIYETERVGDYMIVHGSDSPYWYVKEHFGSYRLLKKRSKTKRAAIALAEEMNTRHPKP